MRGIGLGLVMAGLAMGQNTTNPAVGRTLGGASYPPGVVTNFLVVSRTGSDLSGRRNNGSLPFGSLVSASTNAVKGDTVIVYPGDYTNTANLLKNGVNWYFWEGAVVHQRATNFNHVLFGDGVRDFLEGTNSANLSVTSSISGRGTFWLETPAGTEEGVSPFGLVQVFNAGTVLRIQGKRIGLRGPATLDSWAVAVRDCQKVSVDFDDISTGGDGTAGDAGGGAVYWLNGETEVHAHTIICESGACVYGEQDAGTRGFSDLYVTADVIGTTNGAAVWCYSNAGTNTVWVRAHEIYSGTTSQSYAIWNQGIKLYVVAEKISNRSTNSIGLSGGAPVILVDGGPSYSEQLWVTAQKVSGPGYLFRGNTSSIRSTNVLQVANWECLAGCTNAITQDSGSGKTWILSQLATVPAVAHNSFINHNGGSLTIQGCTVVAPTGVNVGAANFSTKGCTWISSDAASITGASAQTVGTYWSAASVTTNGNITFTPNAGWTVSASAQ